MEFGLRRMYLFRSLDRTIAHLEQHRA
jgi:hypothetical protein